MSNLQIQITIQSNPSAPFIIHKDVRKGDALACLLFNITLEYAIRKPGMQTRGTIFYKSTQLLAHADDVVIIGRSLASMRETFQLLEEASKEVVLVVNEGKTKYMVAASTQNGSKLRAIEIETYNFETADSFTCLGSFVTGDYYFTITNRLIPASRPYFELNGELKSQLLSRKTLILIHKTLMRSVLTYAEDTWKTTKK